MTQPPHELPTDLETAHQLIAELLETVRTQGRFIEKLQHQLEQLLRRIYGRKSEKLDPNQLFLFARELLETAGDDPAAAGEPTPAPSQETVPAAKPAPPKKPGHGRKPLPKHLPRRREVHDVPAELLPCPDCGALRVCIGEEVREQLEYVPACMMVIQHVRPKYACKACEGNVVIAERLPESIEKGLPGPGLLAQVIVSKYADHLPLNRQEGILRRHGVELPRSTTCDWMAVCAGLLEPIVKQMHREILQSRVIQTDDTPVTVLDKLKGRYQGRLWIHLGDRDHPHVVFDLNGINISKYSVNPPASVRRVPCPRPRPRLAVGSVIGIPRRNVTMRRGYDVSGAGPSSLHPHARLCSGLRFHGRNRSTSSIARPPAWAHASR